MEDKEYDWGKQEGYGKGIVVKGEFKYIYIKV